MSTICEHCGADLSVKGVGVDSHYYEVEYQFGFGDAEVGDVLDYYCPVCYELVSDEQYEEVRDGWHGKKGAMNND